MNLNVGMYVRYVRGIINGYVPPRIARITNCEDNELIKIDNGQVILREDVIKASYNLIDLIEVGDYVNGKRVYNISIVDGLKYLDVEVEDYLSDMPFINADQIVSIVTKEQFENMKYEVKG